MGITCFYYGKHLPWRENKTDLKSSENPYSRGLDMKGGGGRILLEFTDALI